MKRLIRTLGTTLPIALFFVTAVSGLMMFFHVGDRFVKGLHEWLSVAFVLGAALHLARHWRAFVGYFRTRTFWAVAAVTTLAGAFFVAPALLRDAPEGGGGGGGKALQRFAEAAALADLAPVLRTTPAALVDRLKGAGLAVPSERASVNEIAEASGRPAKEVLDLALGGAVGPEGRGPRG